MLLRLEFQEGSSSKFWQMEVVGPELTTRWGKIGTAGQTKTKTFADEAAARRDGESQMQAKLRKGYQEVAASQTVALVAPKSPLSQTQPPALDRGIPPELVKLALPTRERPWMGQLGQASSLWAKLREKFGPHSDLRAGAGVCVPQVARVLWQWLDDLEAEQSPARPLEGLSGAIWVTLFRTYEQPYGNCADLALEWMLVQHGLVVTMGALLEGLKWGRRSLHDQDYLMRLSANGWMAQPRSTRGWHKVRQALSLASPADYRKAFEWADRYRASANLEERCLLAFAFPDQDWWRADLSEVLASPKQMYGLKCFEPTAFALLGCPCEVSLIRTLCSSGYTRPNAELAATGLVAMGLEVVPLWLDLVRQDQAFAAPLMLWPEREIAWSFRVLLEDRNLRPLANEYYHRYPLLGMEALSRVVLGGGKVAEVARPLLWGLVAEHSDLLEQLPSKEGELCASLLAKRQAQCLEASPEQTPALLLDPPWKRGKVQKALPSFCELELPAWPERLHAPIKAHFLRSETPPPQGADQQALKRIEAAKKRGEQVGRWETRHLSDPTALRLWNEWEAKCWYDPSSLAAEMLARFGTAALPGVVKAAERDLQNLLPFVADLESAALAPAMAAGLMKYQNKKPIRAWLTRFAEAAFWGLVAPALGKAGKVQEGAWTALRCLPPARLTSLVEQLPEGVRQAMEQILDYDPLADVPAKLPKLPDFAQAGALPRLKLANLELCLPLPAAQNFLQMLTLCPLEGGYAGLDRLKPLLDPASAEEFAWELFSAWLASGAPAKEKWAFWAVGHLGGNESARRLAPMITAWPFEGGFARAELGLDVLCTIATDVALMHLYAMSQKLKSKPLQERAQKRMHEIAERRGLSPEELADRLVPDLELGQAGERTFDFGARRFTLSFDELLRPVVVNQEGKLIADLPKPNQKDDPEKAAQAQKDFKALKKDAKAIAAIQIDRLQRAMALQRHWSWENFEQFFLQHPLLIHLVRRLLWKGYPKGPNFRVAEDGSLADDLDQQIEWKGEVFLPHPLHLGDEQLAQWRAIFQDYAILQPFPQLGRACHRLHGSQLEAQLLYLCQGWQIHPGKLVGLASRGWEKGEVFDGGCFTSMEKPLPEGLRAVLTFEPGIYAGSLAESEPQTLQPLEIHDLEAKQVSLGKLDAISYSELVTDLNSLGGQA
jgi:predicted DNA-binding WGR domain protein